MMTVDYDDDGDGMNAEGERGRMEKSWFMLKDREFRAK